MPEPLLAATLPPAALEGAQVLLRDREGAPLLAAQAGQTPQVLIAFAPTPALRRWPYFNYLLHAAACAASAKQPPRFGAWAGSPVPGPGTQIAVSAGLILLFGVALTLFQAARRAGRRRPDAAAVFFSRAQSRAGTAAPPETSPEAQPGTGPGGPGGPGAPEAPEVMDQAPGKPADAAWSQVGFVRPLSGLLTLLCAMLVFIGPYFALQSLLATHVQPFPEADGLWKTTFDMLWIAWMTFDLGTQTAFVKYFAEHRATRPEDALRDVQFYLWFQIFSRLTEAALLCGLAMGVLPYTSYAHFAPFWMLYSACFIPAVSGIGKLLCQAMQRFDYYNLLDMAEYRALVFLVPVPLVLLGRAWGAAHPIYGEAFGAALGLGLGQLCTNLVMLGLGLFVLRRLGVPLWPLFLAQFDRTTARRQLVFGAKLTIGQEPFRLASLLENIIILRWLQDHLTWLGIRDLLKGRMIWLYFFAWSFYQSAMPAVSEALSLSRRRLCQYYVVRYFQFGYLFSATIFSLLMALGPTFIHGALGPQWGRAADYLLPAAMLGLLLPPAWLGDALQQGAGRPGTNAVIMVIEQSLRLLLLLVLLPRLQFVGIFVAELCALSLKAIVAWGVNHRRIVPLRLPLWPVLGAPALAGLANYLLWRAVVGVLSPQGPSAVLAVFFLAGVGSFFFCFFAVGLFRGLDPAALSELRQAARMAALVGPLCRLLSGVAGLGARLCPLRAPALALSAEVEEEDRLRPGPLPC
jgi:O-antigen/teichoic acid export membrane protein